MKIGIISNLYPPFVRGGAENVVVRTVEALTSQGHDVFVISGRPWVQGQDVLLNKNSTERVYQFFPKNLYFVLQDSRYRWGTRLFWHIIDAFGSHPASRVQAILEEEKPDVVMTHNLKGLGLRIPRAVTSAGFPLIHIVHDLQLLVPSGLKFAGHEKEGFAAPFYAMYRMVTRWLFATADIVVFPSDYLRREYTDHNFFLKSRVVLLQNPAPTFPARNCRAAKTDTLQILFIGQLEAHKGLRFVMDVIANRTQKVHLHIAGEGTLVEEVKAYAEAHSNVTYLGYVAVDQLLSCFEIADALIVPSLCYENSPTVIYESLQSGLPVLASDIGGVGELVESGKNGFLFEAGDADDMLRAIEDLRTRRTWFANNCEAVRDTVQEYSLALYTERIEQLIADLKNRTEIS